MPVIEEPTPESQAVQVPTHAEGGNGKAGGMPELKAEPTSVSVPLKPSRTIAVSVRRVGKIKPCVYVVDEPE